MALLILPTARLRSSYLAAVAEYQASGSDGTTGMNWEMSHWDGIWESPAGFQAYVAGRLEAADEAAPRLEGMVPATTWWWVERDTYLGRISFRHWLNER